MRGELNPPGGGDPIPLLKNKLVIGRRSSCDIILDFPNVSSHHCELEWQNGYWHLQDLNSRNGTKVNGVRVDTKFLMPGDELRIAKHTYVLQYEPQADAPPPVEEHDPFSKSLLEKAGLSRGDYRDRDEPPRSRPANGHAERIKSVNGNPPAAADAKPVRDAKPLPGEKNEFLPDDDDEEQALMWLK